MNLKEFAKSREHKVRDDDPELADWSGLTTLKNFKKLKYQSVSEDAPQSAKYLKAPKKKIFRAQPSMGLAYRGKKISRKELESNCENSFDTDSGSQSENSDSSLTTDQFERHDSFQDNSDAEDCDFETQSDTDGDSVSDDKSDISDHVSQLEEQVCQDYEGNSVVKDSTSQEDVLKKRAFHTLNQITFWNNCMDLVIAHENLLKNFNNFPQHTELSKFVNTTNFETEKIELLKKSLYGLLNNLLMLQYSYAKQHPETFAIVQQSSSNSGEQSFSFETIQNDTSWMDREDLCELIEELEEPLISYCGRAIDKVHKKVMFAKEALSNKFSSINQSITKQVEDNLANKENVHKKIHLLRGSYDILGKKNEQLDQKAVYDDEIYDDGDFYYNLLKEFVSTEVDDENSLFQITRKYLAIKQIQSKKRKYGEKKLPYKGRVLRYNEHPKLIAFMTPSLNFQSAANEFITSQLIGSLFGSHR